MWTAYLLAMFLTVVAVMGWQVEGITKGEMFILANFMLIHGDLERLLSK